MGFKRRVAKKFKEFSCQECKKLSNFDGIIIAVCHDKFKKLFLKKNFVFCNKKEYF